MHLRCLLLTSTTAAALLYLQVIFVFVKCDRVYGATAMYVAYSHDHHSEIGYISHLVN
jgi:hypothetical protein